MEQNDRTQISTIINEEILDKLEAVAENMEPTTSTVEDYKITILATTICHGEKIILRPLVSFDDFVDNYMLELARQSWYTFVQKTYKYGYASFGNVCIFRSTPSDPWSQIDKKKFIETRVRTLPEDLKLDSRKDFAELSRQFYSSYINETTGNKTTEVDIDEKSRGAVMGKMVKYYSAKDPGEFPVKAIMNPLKMRLEIVPSFYSLSGKNTDRQEEELERNPNFFGVSRDFYSGIFTSILSDNRDNLFTFSSLFNLADGKHVMDIFQKLSDQSKNAIFGSGNPITINGSELYNVYMHYIDYWNELVSPRYRSNNRDNSLRLTETGQVKDLNLEIGWKINAYYINDKDGKPRQKNYFILTQINTMNVYVLSNLVFDFLLSKKNNPTEAYRINTKEDLVSWIEELKGKKSKIINITTACETIDQKYMSQQLINDAAKYINTHSIRQTPTQQKMEEDIEAPDQIPFDELDTYISQFESDSKNLGKGRNKNRNRQKYKTIYTYSPQDKNANKFISIIDAHKHAIKKIKNNGTKKRLSSYKKKNARKDRNTRNTRKYKY